MGVIYDLYFNPTYTLAHRNFVNYINDYTEWSTSNVKTTSDCKEQREEIDSEIRTDMTHSDI